MPPKRDYMTIGEVVDHLKPRFPDLSISKIRYYEEEKLIKPERTAGGYRKFKKEDLERLELALRLQQEKYLPLNVIRQNLDMMDMGQLTPEIKQIARESNRTSISSDGEPVPTEKAISSIGLAPEMAKMLESFGIIQTVRTAEGKCYNSTDIKIMIVAREMSKYGIEPRHLRMYLTHAEKEAALFQQILYPMTRQKSDDKNTRIKEELENLNDLADQLRSLLLNKKLKELLKVD